MEFPDDSQRCSVRHGEPRNADAIVTLVYGGPVGSVDALVHTAYSDPKVALCGGCNVYEPWAALVVGAGAGFAFLSVHTLMLK